MTSEQVDTGSIEVEKMTSWTNDKMEIERVEEKYLPVIDNIVRTPYYYACYDMTGKILQEYKKQLEENGVTKKKQEKHFGVQYDIYENDKTRIIIVELEDSFILSTDSLMESEQKKEGPGYESIATAISTEYNNICLSDESVKELKPEVFLTCSIHELYEKTNMMAIQTFTKTGKNAGIYLVSNNKALRLFDSLENVCIADVDCDGKQELLSLFGFGSGIYRINLNVYKYGNPTYFDSNNEVVYCCYSNCYVPKNGYKELAFRKINDKEVHLVELADDEGAESKAIEKNYGKLIIDEEASEICIEDKEDFPFYEWKECYGIEALEVLSDNSNKTFSDEIPELSVTVGEKTLNVNARKVNWNGDCEEEIKFCNILGKKGELPRFKSTKVSEYEEEICLTFEEGYLPRKVEVKDCLLTENGGVAYGKTGVIDREVRIGKEGEFYIALTGHFALHLSSDMSAYTEDSYRGFRVRCEFDENHVCEYVFVLAQEPVYKEE